MDSERIEHLRLMIVAGEVSGDDHAAALVRSLRESAPSTAFEFFGATGAEMRRAGVESIVKTDALSIVGLLEIARALPRFGRAYQTLKRTALERRPDAVILVDWPDFNLRLARALHRQGMKIIYYISPQLWAWRAHRARAIERDIDLLLAILPFEPAWYARRGIHHVQFVGHPLVGTMRPRVNRREFRRLHNLNENSSLIALLPGSRRQEFARILPVMLDAAGVLARVHAEVQFVIALSANHMREEVAPIIRMAIEKNPSFASSPVRVVQGETREALAAADAAGIASGTATLAAGLLNTPHVVVYKESAINWHTLGRLITTEHFGLANLIADERIAPELMQNDFTGESLAHELTRLLEPEENQRVRERLREATRVLDADGASASVRAARVILDALHRWKQ